MRSYTRPLFSIQLFNFHIIYNVIINGIRFHTSHALSLRLAHKKRKKKKKNTTKLKHIYTTTEVEDDEEEEKEEK